uniref:Leucine-rich repeat-containing N-terminal plant-type domain-containing protein n=1 Tax=Solanum lycopersicum TaxID=4081 RepID=A0A3Q7FSD5_SOLLC
MGQNRIRGNIPKKIADLVSLNILHLGILSNLGTLNLDSNRFSCEIPSSIGNITRLLYLYLSGNTLNGTVPPSLAHANNSFMGSLPMEIGDITNLAGFDLSYNNFSGMIPSTIGKCLALELLYMQEGEVPVQRVFSNSTALQVEGNPKLCGGVQEFDLPP